MSSPTVERAVARHVGEQRRLACGLDAQVDALAEKGAVPHRRRGPVGRRGPSFRSSGRTSTLAEVARVRTRRLRRACPLDATEPDDAARDRIGIALETIHAAEELGDERVRRRAVQHLGVADLDDRAGRASPRGGRRSRTPRAGRG
jgi:hypothetical protein